MGLAVAVAAVTVRLFVNGTPPQRRALAVGAPVALLFLVCEILYQLLGIMGAEDSDLYGVVIWVFVAARAAVWYGFLFALISAELFAARAMERLVEQSLHHPSEQELEAMLREPLGDPDVRLEFLDRASGSSDERQGLQSALEEVRAVAQGLYPPLLSDSGLVAALQEVRRRTPVPLKLDADDIARYPLEIEDDGVGF